MFTPCFHGPGTDNLTGMKLQFLEFITPVFRILVNINGWVITCLLCNDPCGFKETGRTCYIYEKEFTTMSLRNCADENKIVYLLNVNIYTCDLVYKDFLMPRTSMRE
ncbi:hypothetical protein HanIR_Chr10g0453171 [Helianthus annuus]|nr:hypothetical protein HanIR_Chr10g0453171 [Helianthus annuus]